jgi:VWFA-related protein
MNATRKLTVLAATVSLLATTLAGGAQDPQTEEPVEGEFGEELAVTEVLLDVLVTDANGNVVIGLGPEDFVVEDQGEAVELVSASFYSNRRFVESSQAAERARIDSGIVPTDRVFILFFHDDRAANPGLFTRPTLDAMRYYGAWVREDLLPNDYVAVVSYDAQLKVWQDFTKNKADIEAALANVLKGGKDPGTAWPSRVPETQEGQPSLLANLPLGKELKKSSRRIYQALQLIADATSTIQGRKNLVFLSWGFGETTAYGGYYPDPRYYPNMIQALNDRNVAVYSIDLVSTTQQGTLLDRGVNNSLSLLSDDTGGRYYYFFDTFAEPLKEVNEENNGYYLLSFQARYPLGDHGYREVKVKTVNPEFRVRARKGYRYGA